MAQSQLEIMLTPATLAAVDKWQIKTQAPSRSAAIRELLMRGLAAEDFNPSDLGDH